MVVRLLEETEKAEFYKLSSICFEYPFNPKGKPEEVLLEEIRNRPPSKAQSSVAHSYGAFTEDNQLMSGLDVIPYDFYFDGHVVKGTGIGNVVTYPHHRRKGAVREIFKAALPKMYEDGMIFSYLYPFSESFYQRFGYHHLNHSLCWDLDLAMIPDFRYEGSFHLLGDTADLQDFSTAYHRFAEKYNLMVKRGPYDWDNVNNAKGCYNNHYGYLYKDENGHPTGYLVFKREVRENQICLICREMVFDGFKTLKALLSFARTYMGDYKYLHVHVPASIPLEHFCMDFSVGSTRASKALNGMVRVVNVREALLLSAYQGSGSFSLNITDPQIPENNGLFTVLFEDGRATKVDQCAAGTVPDCSMPVDIFSAAITGNYHTHDFQWFEGFTLSCTANKLGQIFYKKPSFINNYF